MSGPKETEMTGITRIFACVAALAVACGGVAVAEDGWSASLGQFSRTLAQQRQFEATLANEFSTHHLAFDPQLEDPYYVVNDYHRRPHVYLDRRAWYVHHGNHRIDYRGLSSLNDERAFPWTPFDAASFSHRDRGHYGAGYPGYAGPYEDGYQGGPWGAHGAYQSHDRARFVSGVRQEVPLEYRDSPRGTFFIGPGVHGTHP
jgi:hypothetical protein